LYQLVRSEHPTPQLALMEQWCTVPTRICGFLVLPLARTCFAYAPEVWFGIWPVGALSFKGDGRMRLDRCGIAQVGPQDFYYGITFRSAK